MKRYSILGLVICATLLAALAAPALTQAQSSAQDVTITLNEFAFSPSTITVTQGRTVHFVANNTGKFPHNISFDMKGQMMMVFAQPIKGGSSGEADFTFNDAGTFKIFCPVDSHA